MHPHRGGDAIHANPGGRPRDARMLRGLPRPRLLLHNPADHATGARVRASMRPRHLFDFPLGADARRALCFGAPRQVLCADSPADVRATIRAAERCAQDGAWVAGFVSYRGRSGVRSRPPRAPFRRVSTRVVRRIRPAAVGSAASRRSRARARARALDPGLRPPGRRPGCRGHPGRDLPWRRLPGQLHVPGSCPGFAGDDLAWFLQLREAQASRLLRRLWTSGATGSCPRPRSSSSAATAIA